MFIDTLPLESHIKTMEWIHNKKETKTFLVYIKLLREEV